MGGDRGCTTALDDVNEEEDAVDLVDALDVGGIGLKLRLLVLGMPTYALPDVVLVYCGSP